MRTRDQVINLLTMARQLMPNWSEAARKLELALSVARKFEPDLVPNIEMALSLTVSKIHGLPTTTDPRKFLDDLILAIKAEEEERPAAPVPPRGRIVRRRP
ncbi:hypothetical protein DRP77_13580, partial [Candidatus Poribacteria bacterium]